MSAQVFWAALAGEEGGSRRSRAATTPREAQQPSLALLTAALCVWGHPVLSVDVGWYGCQQVGHTGLEWPCASLTLPS